MRCPCLDCPLREADKNNEVCMSCERRQAYAAALGGMTHSVPDAMTDLRRSAARFKKKEATMARPDGVQTRVDQERGADPVAAPVKICRACGKPLALTEKNFFRSAKSADGFMHMCRSCHAAAIGKGRAAAKTGGKRAARPAAGGQAPGAGLAPAPDSRPAVPAQRSDAVKRCRKCGQEKPIGQFMPSVMSRDGRMHVCLACWRESWSSPTAVSGEVLKIDMTGHREALEALRDQARRELRSVEMQALHIIRQSCGAGPALPAKGPAARHRAAGGGR